ncbi:hypothetical protein ACU045_05020 [Microbacterium sp. MAHUQ-60]|uniref:hypothetical protein n=1 Tax=unclassified Microbacterium TaxID=2609290 RepID=UPI003606CCA7
MTFESQVTLFWILNITISVLAVVIACLLLYLVIRMGVFHGLRAHTRWIDSGKDYEPAEKFIPRR